ncbi:MAG: NAD(P)-dependent oxidoreductase, partial [Candidatus Omnitrophota bacterium]
MNTVLITGGAGFIGRYLAWDILKSGVKVVVFDNLMIKSVLPLNFHSNCNQGEIYDNDSRGIIVKGDIRDSSLLKETFQRYQPDSIIHLAAISDSNVALQSPKECRSVNVDGLNNIFTVLSKVSKVERFIFVSSSYVYGDFNYEPADELHPLNPQHIYGKTKLEGEKMTVSFCTKNNIYYTIIRPTAVYGFGSSLQRVCCKMIIDALAKKEIIIHNDGNQKLDFTHIDDLIQGFSKILYNNNAKNQIFNLSRGRARSIGELAGLIRRNIPQVKIINQNQEFKKPLRGALDISKARNMLGFKPCIDIE